MGKSIHTQIKDAFSQRKPGDIIFPGDFLMFGSPESIHTALSRLADQEEIIRLGKGIYQIPKKDPVVGLVRPSLEDIAHAIAEKEQVIIRPTGSYALNKLGLSTQVPTKVVYLTNGNSRDIKVGKGSIKFKRTTPKRLSITNERIYLVIEALIELGVDRVSPKVLDRLAEVLSAEPLDNIQESAKLAPHAVARILYKLALKLMNHD